MRPAAALLLFAVFIAAAGCGGTSEPKLCGGVGLRAVTGDTTIDAGQSFISAEGEGDECIGSPPYWYHYVFTWTPQDTTIVTAVKLDSMHARITGRAVGQTKVVVTDSTGAQFSSFGVTVR